MNFDFEVCGNPSFATVTPLNPRAKSWLLEHTEGELLKSGDGVNVDLRYVRDLCNGILDAGFCIEKDGHSMVRDCDGELVLESTP